MSERREVQVTLKVQHNGYGADITASCTVEQIAALIAKLQANGIEPANSPYIWPDNGTGKAHRPAGQHGNGNGEPPLCPIHAMPMEPSKYGGWYCTRKNGDGEYCKQKA